MENQVVNWGGALFSASTPKLLQGFMTLFCVLLAVRLLRNAYVAFRESRSENPVFSRGEMARFIESEMRQIQNILEDAGTMMLRSSGCCFLLERLGFEQESYS